MYRLEDIRAASVNKVNPIFIIDHRVMSFFGVFYFAPISTKVSAYHDEVVFIETKTGVMAVNINEMGLPELLF